MVSVLSFSKFNYIIIFKEIHAHIVYIILIFKPAGIAKVTFLQLCNKKVRTFAVEKGLLLLTCNKDDGLEKYKNI